MVYSAPGRDRITYQKIIERLQAAFPDWRIAPFPGLITEKEQQRIVQYQTIWVALEVDTSPSEGTGVKQDTVQSDTIAVTLTYINRDLRSHESTIDICDWTREELTGFIAKDDEGKLLFASPLQSNGYRFQALVEGFWVYRQTFTARRAYARKAKF